MIIEIHININIYMYNIYMYVLYIYIYVFICMYYCVTIFFKIFPYVSDMCCLLL